MAHKTVMLHGTLRIDQLPPLLQMHAHWRALGSIVRIKTPSWCGYGKICTEVLVGYGPDHGPKEVTAYIYFELVNVDGPVQHENENTIEWSLKLTFD